MEEIKTPYDIPEKIKEQTPSMVYTVKDLREAFLEGWRARAALARDVVSKDTIAMTLTSALLSGFTVAVDRIYALQLPKMNRKRMSPEVANASE